MGSTKLHLRDAYLGIPPKGSYMQKICDRHNISPETAPIPNYQADPLLTNETQIPANPQTTLFDRHPHLLGWVRRGVGGFLTIQRNAVLLVRADPVRFLGQSDQESFA